MSILPEGLAAVKPPPKPVSLPQTLSRKAVLPHARRVLPEPVPALRKRTEVVPVRTRQQTVLLSLKQDVMLPTKARVYPPAVKVVLKPKKPTDPEVLPSKCKP